MSETMSEQLTGLRESYHPGVVILRQGDSSRDVFVLVEGSAVVQVDGQVIRTLEVGAGDHFFGELATLLDLPRTATVTALSGCVVLKIPAAELLEVLCNHPKIAHTQIGATI